jgi:uncharacterized membrane protein YphA (DoxX/SURF4 family)
MNIALWIVQVLLAGMFGMAGTMKTFSVEKVRGMMPWAKDSSTAFIRFIGISELLGGLGMILPILTGILSWLTPVAAIGFFIIQILAIVTVHLPRKEYSAVGMNVVLLALSAFVVWGYLSLFSF